MTQALSLSVLVPLYNERYLVGPSLSRLLALKSNVISEMEVILVDDCSTDGSWEEAQQIAEKDPRVKLFRHEKNAGKGAAVRTALEHASKDICIVHDADMEYNPNDIPGMVRVFLEEGADAVFGSRYLSAFYRRVLMYRHALINKIITFMVNWVTDLDLSDVETCYKAVKTPLLKGIPLRSNDFRFEVELTMKLARRRIRIFEVPIRYLPRGYEEGKKIRFRDGLLALLTVLQSFFIEDLYHTKAYGLTILHDMNKARRFNKWMADTLRPYIGNRVLEIGAGIATLTNEFIPREIYVASDIERQALDYLKSYAIGKPYLKVMKLDACDPGSFKKITSWFDTVLIANVLEQLPDESAALKNFYTALQSGGRAVILAPQGPGLYGSFDKALHYRERYTEEKLTAACRGAGFEIEKTFDFNRSGVPSWILNAKILKRKRYSRIQLKIREILMPLVRRIDGLLPWRGLSLIAIARKP